MPAGSGIIKKTMKLLSIFACSAFLVAASPLAVAQDMPTPEQFKQWDAKFKPGLYEFVDHELDKDGQPREKGSHPRRECIDRMKAYFLGRGTPFAEPLKSCRLLRAKLDSKGLVMSHNCSEPEEKARPLIGVLLVSPVEPDTFMATVFKQVHNRDASVQEPVSGMAHLFRRVGNCQ